MSGLIYREYRVILPNIIAFLPLPLLTLICMTVFRVLSTGDAAVGTDEATLGQLNVFIDFLILMLNYSIFFCIQSIGLQVFSNMEEKKLHMRYIAAAPCGIRGIVNAKFIFYFMISTAGIVFILIMNLIFLHKPMIFAVMLVFELLTVSAMLHIPVFIRFGKKRGSHVSGVLFIAVIIAGLIWLLFGDIGLSEDNIIPLPELMMNAAAKLISTPETLLRNTALILLPVTAVITLASMKLSQKWFGKALEYNTDDM